jgi:hypothetical protein
MAPLPWESRRHKLVGCFRVQRGRARPSTVEEVAVRVLLRPLPLQEDRGDGAVAGDYADLLAVVLGIKPDVFH